MIKILLIIALVLVPWSVTLAASIERLPNAAGNYSELTPSAGSNYENVDDPSSCDESSTMNFTNVDDERDCYTFPVSGGSAVPKDSLVDSVVVVICCDHQGPAFLKDSAKIFIRYNGSGAANYDGTRQAVTGAWGTISQTWTTNPKTSAAWAVSEANDDDYQFGIICVEANTTTEVSRVTTTWHYSWDDSPPAGKKYGAQPIRRR